MRTRISGLNTVSTCVVLLGGLLFASGAGGASFDCRKASTRVEKLICLDESLSRQDELMANQYKAALARHPVPELVKARQRDFLVTQRACTDAACLQRIYTQRIRQLERAGSTAVFSLNGGERDFLTPGSAVVELSRIQGQEYVVSVFSIRNPPGTSDAKYVVCDFEAPLTVGGPQLVARGSSGELRSTLSADFSAMDIAEDRLGCGGFGGDIAGRYKRIGVLPSGFALPVASSSTVTPRPPPASRAPEQGAGQDRVAVRDRGERNAPQNAAPRADDGTSALAMRCAEAAFDVGYPNGRCARSYIDTCVKTQSRTEMANTLQIDKEIWWSGWQQILRIDRSMQTIRGLCDHQAGTYEAAFEAVRARRDRP